MLNNPLDNASGYPVTDLPAEEQKHAMRLGSAFNCIQFAYRDFKCDRLADVLNYSLHHQIMNLVIHAAHIGLGGRASS